MEEEARWSGAWWGARLCGWSWKGTTRESRHRESRTDELSLGRSALVETEKTTREWERVRAEGELSASPPRHMGARC
jgi:hypothetical protein